MAGTYSKKIADGINTYLTEDDWKFSFDDEKGVFEFGLNLSEGKIPSIMYIIAVHDDGYTVYAASPLNVNRNDEKAMAAMAEFVCRANFGLRKSNFELNVSDGEILCKVYVSCDDVLPKQDMVKESIMIPASMFRRYGDGIVDVIFSNDTAESAIYRCEHKQEHPKQEHSRQDSPKQGHSKKFEDMFIELPDEINDDTGGDQSNGGEE